MGRSGGAAFAADVLLQGNRIAAVRRNLSRDSTATQRIDVSAHTVMPGLVEGHAHLRFAHKANPAELGDIPPEDHTFITLLHARILLDAGFTSCLSGGSAKPRLDVAYATSSTPDMPPVRGF